MTVKMDFSQQQALLKERQRQYQESLGAEMEHSSLYGFRVPSRLPLCSTTSMDVNVSDLEDLSLDDMSNPGSLGTDDLEYDLDDADVFEIVDYEETDFEQGEGDNAEAGGTACCQQADRQVPRAGPVVKNAALNSAVLPASVTATNFSQTPASLTQSALSRTSSDQSGNISQQLDLPQNTCHRADQCEGAIHNEGVRSNQSAEACQHGQLNCRIQLDNREAILQNPTADMNTNRLLEKETKPGY
ncbi:uncharacterized protein [Branchiostoma lanceolatum]|uniref:Hypp3990 protein n=1 Tax=Branchiostoma lanceolatum TaxID=7740 RepID=A0A8K0A4N4_BRALA|nr:Hypp3990 [Branchiostoma lanceolatum]